MKLAALTVDPAKIEGGEWIDNLPECGDLRIRTKGLNNAAYRALNAKLIAAVPRAERRAGLKPETVDRITAECVAQTCLLEWENLIGEDDAPIPFSQETASKLLPDPKYKPLLDACVMAASRVGEERAEDIEGAGKN